MASIGRFKGTQPLPFPPLFGARRFRKSITTGMKLFSSLKGFNSRLEQAEEMVSEHEDKAIEIIQFEEQKGKKNE